MNMKNQFRGRAGPTGQRAKGKGGKGRVAKRYVRQIDDIAKEGV